MESKYNNQIKHLRKNYSRLTMDFKPDMLETFKQKCKANNTTPTTEIKRFIAEYCKDKAGE